MKSRRAKGNDWFIAEPRGKFVCADCNYEPGGPQHDPSDSRVEVWPFFSEGWTAPCICRLCRLSLPIYVNARARGR